MKGMFSKSTTKEVIRNQRRSLNRSIRELTRERNAMKREEGKLIAEIKKMAKQGKLVNNIIQMSN